MKKLLIFFVMLFSMAYGQDDPYGTYFNVSKMIPPPKGNGITNDANVFRKALVEHKAIYIPYTPNGYNITDNLVIPENCKLVFAPGAKFVGTGTIIGNNTQIEGYGQIFGSNISTAGTWLTPFVPSSWFGNDLTNYNNFISLLDSSDIAYLNINSSSVTSNSLISAISDTAANIREDIPVLTTFIYDSLYMIASDGDTFSLKISGDTILLTDISYHPPALKLGFDDIANTPVADSLSVSDWNTFFGLPANGTAFSSVSITDDTVFLYHNRAGAEITIKSNLFKSNKNIEYVYDIPGCIISCKGDAFNSADSLIEVYLPECREFINSCFVSSNKLATVIAPQVTMIDEWVFQDCTSLDSILFSSVDTIGSYAFSECSSLVRVNFPLVRYIDSDAFSYCTSATTFNFPICNYIGYTVFDNCTSMTSISIPGVNTTLGPSAAGNWLFGSITGNTITVSCGTAILTCNGGAPDEDLCTLNTNNTITVNGEALTTCP